MIAYLCEPQPPTPALSLGKHTSVLCVGESVSRTVLSCAYKGKSEYSLLVGVAGAPAALSVSGNQVRKCPIRGTVDAFRS